MRYVTNGKVLLEVREALVLGGIAAMTWTVIIVCATEIYLRGFLSR